MKTLSVYVPVKALSEQFAATISSYEKLFGMRCDLLFGYKAGQLQIARVEPIVIIGGSWSSLGALHF